MDVTTASHGACSPSATLVVRVIDAMTERLHPQRVRESARPSVRLPGCAPVPFDEAATAFGDPLSLAITDPDHSGDEERSILLEQTLPQVA